MILVDPMRPVRKRAPQPTPEASLKPVEPAVKKKHHRRFRWQWLLVVAMVAALLVLPEFIGQLVLIVYAIVVLIKRVVVHLTFGLAILFLVLSPLLSVLTGSEGNGGVLASYSFMLLAVGFMQAIREYRRLSRVRPGVDR